MPAIKQVVFSPKAAKRVNNVADYLYRQTQSKAFVVDYMQKLTNYFIDILITFPESGVLVEVYGKSVRKLTHNGYVLLYRINSKNQVVEALNFFKENLP
jgi:mRNA-degrading endonuclease RelE of RelBE toxin-antitoxin system